MAVKIVLLKYGKVVAFDFHFHSGCNERLTNHLVLFFPFSYSSCLLLVLLVMLEQFCYSRVTELLIHHGLGPLCFWLEVFLSIVVGSFCLVSTRLHITSIEYASGV